MTHVELVFPHRPDDRELADLAVRAGGGDVAAFERLARHVRAQVTAWAGAITGDRDDAEDIAQLVLLRLHERVAEFEGRSRFTSWLYRIVRNVSFARERVVRRRRALLERHVPELRADTDAPAPPGTDIRALAERSLDGLPEAHRMVFERVDLEGKRVIDVAAELRLNPVTARGYLLRARRAIRLRILAEHPEILKEFEP